MSPLFIIGYMASGKTTFGRALARETGMRFIDLDFYIEQRFRKTVRRIFDESGEDAFRRIERSMLREVGEFEDVIVSCGGGTPCFFDNMDYMLGRGRVVFLDTGERRITERIVANSSRRPLMADKSEEEIASAVRQGLESRMPYYSRAHISMPGDCLEDRAQIKDTVTAFLKKYPL